MTANHPPAQQKKPPQPSAITKMPTKLAAAVWPALVLLLVLGVVLGAAQGAADISPAAAAKILLAPLKVFDRLFANVPATATQAGILWRLRLPRVAMAGLVGASLAVAGAVFQCLFRNPMADPYVLGVSSGAALGAVLAMLTAEKTLRHGFFSVPAFAFAGGVGALLLVYHVARVGRAVPVMSLLLTGIAMGSFLSAGVSLLTYFAGEKLDQVVFWMMGGVQAAGWRKIAVMLPYAAAGFGIIYSKHKEMDILLLGEETAQTLGVATEPLKKMLLAAASLLVAAAVSTSGIIGFVGLVVPHFVRLVFGPGHRRLLGASAILGAALLIHADTLARTIIAPAELPVGIITATVGAPVFILLIKRRKQLRYFGAGG
jgi:iron complex transport system permease protein